MRKLTLKGIIWLPSELQWLQGSEPEHETISFDRIPVGYQKYSWVIFYQTFQLSFKSPHLGEQNR